MIFCITSLKIDLVVVFIYCVHLRMNGNTFCVTISNKYRGVMRRKQEGNNVEIASYYHLISKVVPR